MSEQKAYIETGSNGNTIVQIVGDGNTVVVTEYRHLELTCHTGRCQQVLEIQRLSPYSLSTRLVGRDQDLADLARFLDDQRPILIRVLTGRGGSGKTRLALELCERFSNKGWNAGFATRSEVVRFTSQQNSGNWGWQKPTLIVIDYAAAQTEALGNWFDELTANAPDQPKPRLRFLLLERHADEQAGWFQTLFRGGGWSALGRQGLLDPLQPVSITALLDPADRRALLAEVLEREAPRLALPVDNAAFDLSLQQISWGGEPLFLMMAAHAMARQGWAQALTMNREDLALQLAANEADRLDKLAIAAGVDTKLIRHLASCVTLAQGMDRDRFLEFAEAERRAVGRSGGGDPAVLADLLEAALPSADGISAILPDMIGEAFVVATLVGKGSAAVLRCYESFGPPVMECAIRCAQDFALLSSNGMKAPMGWLDSLIEACTEDAPALAQLLVSMPMASVALREIRLRVANKLYSLRDGAGSSISDGRALAASELAVALSQMGQREEAVVMAQEAVDLRRQMAARRPDAFRPQLAWSLNNLASFISAVGDREGALATAQEALVLCRQLAAQRPDAFRPDVATSLNNLANFLSAVGDWEGGLAAAKEALALNRQLAAQHPDAFQSDLATSLSNLANRLGEVGDREGALAAAQEALAFCRQLAAQRPDAFRPDLALSLNNLSNFLSEVGDREGALATAQEAVVLRRQLAVQRPDAFQPSLATSLSNLTNRLSEAGDQEGGLKAAEEAVFLFRQLTAQRPDAFLPDLGMSLNNLANRLNEVGDRQGALAAAQEALTLYRQLVAQRPDAFRPNLAALLNNLANRLGAVGDQKGALAAAQEALTLYRELEARRPDAFRPNLAGSLNNLANLIGAIGDREGALAAVQEALRLHRQLVAQRPDVFRPDLATSLSNLANWLSKVGDREGALAAAEEAVALYRQLATQRSDAFRPDLARTLIVLALRESELKRRTAAAATAREAVATLLPHFQRQPKAHAALLFPMLLEYLRLYSAAGIAPDQSLLDPFMSYVAKES